MKGELTFKILETIERASFATADIIDVFTSGYAESYRKARRGMLGYRKHRESWVEKLKNNQKFYNLLYKLQKKGLVLKQKRREGTFWIISRKGEERLQKLKERLLKRPPKKNYPSVKSKSFKIVSFDIPEFNRKQRDWLRETLKRLNYQLVQKSVWIGKNELPIEFIEDLRKYNILNNVEIFSINRKGTI